jgi:hypothetical protein
MRTRLIAVLLVFVMAAALTVGVQAQDEMMLHVCDSTLIMLLYIAEHDYGFHSMMDVSTFDKGQFAPLFDAMMAEMSGEMMGQPEATMMPEGEMMMQPMEGVSMLVPATIADEDPACTALRNELDTFLYKTLSEKMMMAQGS